MNVFLHRSIMIQDLINWVHLAEMLGLILFVGIIAGWYPALFLSSHRPVHVLKGKGPGMQGQWIRNVLVVCQFGISAGLILATLFIGGQLHFMKHSDMGYDTENVIEVWLSQTSPSKRALLREAWTRNPGVKGVSYTSNTINYMGGMSGFRRVQAGTDETESIAFQAKLSAVDAGFVDVFQLNLLRGRNFSELHNDIGTIIVNEAFVKNTGMENPVDRIVHVEGKGELRIIGVFKDVHMSSLHHTIQPTALVYNPENVIVANIRLEPVNMQGTLQYMERIFQEFHPDKIFEYSFLEDSIEQMYVKEIRLGTLVSLSAGLAVFLACLGLLGLVMFSMSRRTREIGVRKVLGAEIIGLITFLSKDFLKLVFIANLIVWPIVYWLMRDWLLNFAYRIQISLWHFMLTGLTTVVLTMVTIGFQVLKTARTNPVESLRYE